MKVLKDLAISESGFIFNPISGESFTVNELGMFILNLLKTGKSKSEIKQKIAEEYEVSDIEIEKDFEDFTKMMEFYNLMAN